MLKVIYNFLTIPVSLMRLNTVDVRDVNYT